MLLESFLLSLRQALLAVTPLEAVAVLFGIAQVLLARRGSIWNYGAGIVSTALTVWLMANAKLYAEAGLNVYYVLISIWGIYAWRRQPVKESAPGFTTTREWKILVAISVFGTAGIALLLYRFTASDVPVWDGAVSAIAWAGTWLLTRRRVENWLVLNVSNLLAIPLQIHKGLYLYALLTAILTMVAFDAYRVWRRQAVGRGLSEN